MKGKDCPRMQEKQLNGFIELSLTTESLLGLKNTFLIDCSKCNQV